MVEYEITCRECEVTVDARSLYKHLRDEHGLEFDVEQVIAPGPTMLQIVEDMEGKISRLPSVQKMRFRPQVWWLKRQIGKLRDSEIERMLK